MVMLFKLLSFVLHWEINQSYIYMKTQKSKYKYVYSCFIVFLFVQMKEDTDMLQICCN